jgi:hypothetical protein
MPYRSFVVDVERLLRRVITSNAVVPFDVSALLFKHRSETNLTPELIVGAIVIAEKHLCRVDSCRCCRLWAQLLALGRLQSLWCVVVL